MTYTPNRLPWTVEDGRDVVDAMGESVAMAYSEGVAEFIRDAANARLTSDWFRHPILCDTCAGSGDVVMEPYGHRMEVKCPSCGGDGGFCRSCKAPSQVPICPPCIPH